MNLVLLTAVLSLIGSSAFALSTDTLPAGINSPSIRSGSISGIDQKYLGDGSLYGLGDTKSIQFTSRTLQDMSPRARQLVEALNHFGSQDLGSKINYGILRVHIEPQVNYTAPIYAKGITDKWTLGVGFPVINYKNKISLSTDGSNLEYYRTQFSGLSDELKEALDINLVTETQTTLQSKGYRRLEDHNDTFLGDIQVSSLYRFFENTKTALMYQATLILPTGPKYNPDDLAALNVFGQTAVENRVIGSYLVSTSVEVAPYVAYIYPIQDKVTMRVPTDENDTLPDENSKENVRRQLGATAVVGSDLFYNLDDQFSFGVGYSFTQKDSDRISGDEGRRYDLLEANTSSRAQLANIQVNFSTVKTYMKKQSLIPMKVSYNFIDTLAGSNVERRTTNELNLILFF